jgi:hypothetical protein
VILVDEMSRLSRQDLISFIITIIGPLRDAGIRLHSAVQSFAASTARSRNKLGQKSAAAPCSC